MIMKILVYSKIIDATISDSLGLPEYSYYFAKKEFMPILLELGDVEEITNPEEEVDTIYEQCKRDGKDCVYLSFTPPHLMETNLVCPSVCIFAWEFSSIPEEAWNDNPGNNWRQVLAKVGFAITHSEAAKTAVTEALGVAFPIVAIPSPVWDKFADFRSRTEKVGKLKLPSVLDSRAIELEKLDPLELSAATGSEYYQYAVSLIAQRDSELGKLSHEFNHAENLVKERDEQLEKANNAREYAEKLVNDRDEQLEKANHEREYAESIIVERDAQLVQVNEELNAYRATLIGRLNAWLVRKRRS